MCCLLQVNSLLGPSDITARFTAEPPSTSTSTSSPISPPGRRDEAMEGVGGLLPGQTAVVFKRLFLGSTIWCVPLNS